ncbi:bestrophin family protein [Caulobacter mirabilis]|uniref:Bestrophin n=1 Tax=Caulobacter mirabilis TaxID=69666 RepID=A0A2D2AY50_9CAUL|nr:bestrophin family protein [Caulobacter mirabilis]ATQ42857.1 bestrophin [Caulobacter mirabilis]
MIVGRWAGLFEVAFARQGSILPRIAVRLAVLGAISIVAVLAAERLPHVFERVNALPFTLLGLALSIFMSFRNNACYDRWWEARKLWGRLIIASRAFARQTRRLAPEAREPLLLGLAAFAGGLAARLRDQDEPAAIARWRPGEALAPAPNPTDAVLSQVGADCARLADQGAMTPVHLATLELQLTELSHVQAGCERIRTTPLPFAYSLLLHRTAHLFCLLLPFALAHALGWWTPLLVLVVGYTFFGLDALGDQLEDPFGLEDNDLPLDALVRTVERDLLFSLGREDLPPLLEPVGYRLS